jgi:cell wall-associated NlpC family hydrolase
VTAHRIRIGYRRVLTLTALVAAVFATTTATAAADPSVGDIEDKIEEQAHDLEGIVEDYNAIVEDLEDTKDQIKKLEDKLEPYREELDKLYDQTEPIVTAAYVNHNMSGTFAILNAGSPQRFADRMTALDGATSADSALISEVVDAKAKYEEDMAVLEDLKAEQADQEADIEDKKSTIEDDINRLQDDRKDAYRDEAASRGQSVDYIPEYVPGDRGVVVRHAMEQLGDPYVWAAAGPDSYDCSGLILDAYNQIGISLPHNAAQMYDIGTHIGRDQLQPGDAVYYNGLQHIAMYLGDGMVIHAPTFGDVVKIQPIDEAATPYYGATTFV